MSDNKQALARYNKLFDNQKYQEIADRLAVDLRVDRDSVRVADAMNCLTDTALFLSGHSHYADAWVKLAAFCGKNAVSLPTLDLIYGYLLIFQQASNTDAVPVDDVHHLQIVLIALSEVHSVALLITCMSLFFVLTSSIFAVWSVEISLSCTVEVGFTQSLCQSTRFKTRVASQHFIQHETVNLRDSPDQPQSLKKPPLMQLYIQPHHTAYPLLPVCSFQASSRHLPQG
ncbi:MAG: hypothetical protein RLP44_29840 [Aggregatilineales bacterium]